MPRNYFCIDFSGEFCFRFDDVIAGPHFERITFKIQCNDQGSPSISRHRKNSKTYVH